MKAQLHEKHRGKAFVWIQKSHNFSLCRAKSISLSLSKDMENEDFGLYIYM